MRRLGNSLGLALSGVLVLAVNLTAFAGLSDPPYQDDFLADTISSGEWSNTFGSVSWDGASNAVFAVNEGDNDAVLEQSFTLPGNAVTLRFGFTVTSTGTYDPVAAPDALVAYLWDGGYAPLVNIPGYDEFYYLDHTGYEDLGPGVASTVAGGTGTYSGLVSLDVAAFAGLDVILEFDVLSGFGPLGMLDGMDTTVAFDFAEVVVPLPGAAVLALLGLSAAGLHWRRAKL
jgi:hypothetical protein